MSYIKTKGALGATQFMVYNANAVVLPTAEVLSQIISTMPGAIQKADGGWTRPPFAGAVWIPHEQRWIKPPFPNAVWVGDMTKGHWETKKAPSKPGSSTITVTRREGGWTDEEKRTRPGPPMTPGSQFLPKMGNITAEYLRLLLLAQGSEEWKAAATAAGVEWKHPYGKKFHSGVYKTIPIGVGTGAPDGHKHQQFYFGQTGGVGARDAVTASSLKKMLAKRGWSEAKMQSTRTNASEETKLKKDLAIIAHDYVAKWEDKILKLSRDSPNPSAPLRIHDPHWNLQVDHQVKQEEGMAEGKRDHRLDPLCKTLDPRYYDCCMNSGVDVYQFKEMLQAGDPRVTACMVEVDTKKKNQSYLMLGALAAVAGFVLYGKLKK